MKGQGQGSICGCCGQAIKESASTAVSEVFDYWRTVLNHPDARLSNDRRAKIQARLKDGYTVEQLKLAVDGCKASAFHQGQNDLGRVYDSVELIFRNGDKVESFIGLAGGSNGRKAETAGERRIREAQERRQLADFGKQFFR